MSGWRRFERGSRTGGSDRFWAIRVVGRDCEIRSGWIDDIDETDERLSHGSEAEARRTARKRIRTKQLAGWVEVEQVDEDRVSALERGEALEQAIAADPSNLASWAVYADWMQEIEPLLGERIALGLALARAVPTDKRAQIKARIEELERTHARELFGPTLAGVLRGRKFAGVVELERQLGMIVGAKLSDPMRDVVKFDAVLGAVLDLPLARLLLQLWIDAQPDRAPYWKYVEVFVARRHPVLRRLTIGSDGGAVPEDRLPELQALLDQTPRLERLELHGRFLGHASHPLLRELKLRRDDEAPACTLSSWRLPALETLHLHGPGAVNWAQVEFPRLRRLLIEQWDHGDELVEKLARAPLLDQLESLVLTDTSLTSRGIQTILAHRERYATLRRLVVLDVVAEGDAIERLHEALPNAHAEVDDPWQSYDEDDWPDPLDSPARRRRELTRF